ncbi:hypothetical protein [Pelagimonas varians]|nr:hypothetical protein [Pelagimonas varians]
MDRATDNGLTWRPSNTLYTSFSIEALNEVIIKYGKPDVMNSDQLSHFTVSAWFTTLTEADVKILMGGRSLKRKAINLHELHDGVQAKRGIDSWIGFYTSKRLCCTNPMLDSPFESSMIAVSYEQLVPYKI